MQNWSKRSVSLDLTPHQGRVKWNKSPGFDNIFAEYLVYGGLTLYLSILCSIVFVCMLMAWFAFVRTK